MNSSNPSQPRAPWLIPWIVAFDALLILFPPIHWLLQPGSTAMSLTYVLGAPVVLFASLFLLNWASGNIAERDEDTAGGEPREH